MQTQYVIMVYGKHTGNSLAHSDVITKSVIIKVHDIDIDTIAICQRCAEHSRARQHSPDLMENGLQRNSAENDIFYWNPTSLKILYFFTNVHPYD